MLCIQLCQFNSLNILMNDDKGKKKVYFDVFDFQVSGLK